MRGRECESEEIRRSPPARAVPHNPFLYLRAARPLRGVPVSCLVFVAMALAHACTGSAEDITVTAGPTFMDAGRNVTAPSSDVTAAEGESAGHKPARSLVTAPRATAPAVATGWQVQLGAFRSETRAAKARAALAQTLADLPRAGVLAIDDSKGDGLFRVMVADAFAHRSEATATCAAITARGAQCFVARASARAAGAASVPAARALSESSGRKPVAAAPVAAPAPGVLERLDTLEAENRQLRNEIEALKAERTKPSHAPPSRAGPAAETTAARFVRTDSKFGCSAIATSSPSTPASARWRCRLA